MEESQSLNNLIENELGFDISQLDCGESLHADDPVFPKTFEDAVHNNGIGYATSTIGLNSAWLNDFTSFGGRFGPNSEDEIEVAFEPELPSQTDSEKLANGRSIDPYLNNWIANNNNNLLKTVPGLGGTAFTASQTTERSNGQLLGDFALPKQPDLAREVEICLQKRKVAVDSTTNDEVDGLVEVSDNEEKQIPKTRKRRSFDSDHFEIKKARAARRSADSSTRGREDMIGIQTDRKRNSLEASGFGTTNSSSFVSSKAMTTFASKRGEKTRKSRNASVDFSPVPSPAAEVPSASPVDTTQFIDDYELVSLDTKELNKRVKTLPKRTVDEIKHRRRTLKNRGYARSCREKKISETSTLQLSNGDLAKELSSTKFELELARLKRDEWKRRFESLVSALKIRGVKFTNNEA